MLEKIYRLLEIVKQTQILSEVIEKKLPDVKMIGSVTFFIFIFSLIGSVTTTTIIINKNDRQILSS